MSRNPLLGLVLCLAACNSFADETAPIPVEAFFSYSKVSSAKISPDGKYLAMVVSDNDTGADRKFLAVIGTDDRKIKSGFRVAEGHEIYAFWWANNGRVLIATATETGALSVATFDGSLYGINVDSTQPLQLLGPKPDGPIGVTPEKLPLRDPAQNFTHISNKEHKGAAPKAFTFDGMLFIPRNDANHVLVEGQADDSAKKQVLDVDVYSGDVNVVVTSPTHGGRFETDSQGHVRIAIGEDDTTGEPQLFYRESDDSPQWHDLSALYRNTDAAYDATGPLGFTPDDKQLYWYGRTTTGTMGLFTVDPADLSVRPLYSDPDFDVESMVWDEVSANAYKLIAAETMPGLPMMHYLDTADRKTKILQALQQAFPGQEVYITSATQDGGLMVVFVGSDRNPGDYYLFSGKSLKADYLFSTLDGIDPDRMAPMQPVQLRARDGLDLHAYLTAPVDRPPKNLPLILLPHGGPHQVRDEWGWDPEVQFFAYHGYAVLQVNYRGSDGYGLKFQDLGYLHWGTTMQDDLADAVTWAVKQGIADPQRICIYGASYGGYAAIENVIRYPDLYKCAVGYVGVYDLTLEAKHGDVHQSAYGRHYLKLVRGDDQDELKKYSPVYNADKISIPVFIAYGGKDQRVVPSNAKELMAAMDEAGKKYESLFDPYEDHGFKKPQNRFELYTRMLQFMDKYIGPEASKAQVEVPKAGRAP